MRPAIYQLSSVFQLVTYQSRVGVGNDFQGESDVGDESEKARGNATGWLDMHSPTSDFDPFDFAR
jgi:hypothetical protein